MTAAERLAQLSGLAGVSAAAMLLAIGTGGTAGALLLSRSSLASDTAAAHLLDAGNVVIATGGGGWIGKKTKRKAREESRPVENDEALIIALLM